MDKMDKLDIYVPENIGSMLEYDAEMFEIFKTDRKTNKTTINKNKFLSMLIVGYYKDYVSEAKSAKKTIKAAIDTDKISSKEKDAIADTILKTVVLPAVPPRKGKNPKKFSLKPTAATETLIKQIDRDIDDYISQYFCRMFMSYSRKPFSQRERIIFKDKYDTLLKACISNQIINFRTIWNPNDIHEVIPYKIVAGPEEMFNYLLCAEYNTNTQKQETKSYRLNRIHETINCSENIGVIDDAVKNHLEMMIKYGPAYTINDDEMTHVRLSKFGVRDFNRIYFGRPVVDKIEPHDDVFDYYFKGSKDQIFFYFRRFENDEVEIISPKSLRERMITFHRNAISIYEKG